MKPKTQEQIDLENEVQAGENDAREFEHRYGEDAQQAHAANLRQNTAYARAFVQEADKTKR